MEYGLIMFMTFYAKIKIIVEDQICNNMKKCLKSTDK